MATGGSLGAPVEAIAGIFRASNLSSIEGVNLVRIVLVLVGMDYDFVRRELLRQRFENRLRRCPRSTETQYTFWLLRRVLSKVGIPFRAPVLDRPCEPCRLGVLDVLGHRDKRVEVEHRFLGADETRELPLDRP